MANFSIFVPLIYHIPMTFGVLPSFSNKTFNRYGGYFELMRFKECYRMPRSHVHDSIYSLPIYARFSDQSSLSFPRKRLSWEKKIVVPCLDVIMIAFFPRNIQWSSLFAQKARVKNKRVPPGDTISKGKGAHEPKTYRDGVSFQFNSVAFWMGWKSIAGLPPSSMSPVPIYTPGWRETNWSKVPCLRKQCGGRGLNPGPPDPEFEMLTARSHTIMLLISNKYNMAALLAKRSILIHGSW